MASVIVLGAQWGDEGKGKIVDYLAQEADVVVRYSGGSNAGHTVVVNDIAYKLRLLPSGVLFPDKINVLGNGLKQLLSHLLLTWSLKQLLLCWRKSLRPLKKHQKLLVLP